MKLLTLCIPDDPAHLPAWLEQHLLGADLRSLAAELSAVHAPPADGGPSLCDLLGNRRRAVLVEGLAVLPSSAVKQLLSNPRLLLELQELVLAEGSPYWTLRDGAPSAFDTVAERGRDTLAAYLRPRR